MPEDPADDIRELSLAAPPKGASLVDYVGGSIDLDRSLPSRIAERLAAAIIEGALKPGARLSEPDLAETFGTSRTPVREALRILERDSLVEVAPRRGARVSVIDGTRVTEIYVCRGYLYALAAKLGCQLADDEDVEELGGIVAEMVATVAQGDTHGYFRLNVSLHERVTELANNTMLLSMIEQLGRVTLRLRFLSVSLPGRMEESLRWHEQLLQAFEMRDAARAERVVRCLIRDAGESLLRFHYGDGERADYLASVLTPDG